VSVSWQGLLDGFRTLARSRAYAAECVRLGEVVTALAAERDELLQHGLRLDAERRERMEQCAVLTRERDELKEHAARLEAQVRAREGLFAPPGHFYSPLVDRRNQRLQQYYGRYAGRLTEQCAAVRLDDAALLGMFERIAAHYPEAPFPESRRDNARYYYENPAFSYADAVTLYGMLREFKPRRLIDIGSGFSSCACMDVNDRFFGGAMELSFHDPHPETLLGLLAAQDPYRECVYTTALQEIPLASFERLEPNDILLIDSSHVAKTASDVNDYLFRVLPALRPGVLVHIHDILYPFEYPPQWVLHENRSWNEAYLVKAFLMYNSAFEVVFFCDYVYNRYAAETEQRMPLCRRNTGGSLWLRKRRN
jgi:hypothetical protein